ncbi:metal ABC transporter permease [Uliginosibacterium paludis]|uniref:Metal ABC transporter permease n=2 Tax=Uliginosibacterium paludis TaxID=1615952 RepID=A0ABV2CVL6_9RHOO
MSVSMTGMFDLAVGPFIEFGFMRRALVACLALALCSGPMGVLLVLRRMSLVGDAMAHALLPGAAVGFMFAGFSLGAMSAGSFVAAMLVALGAGAVVRLTPQREDASFAAFYLIALAAGVMIISLHGSSVDLMHVLFGAILAVDDAALLLVACVASVVLAVLALIYRPLVVECCDPEFLRALGGRGGLYHLLFLGLLVATLVSGFQALGTLMGVGLMMLPAVSARFWARSVGGMASVAALMAFVSGYAGLLGSYYADLPSGPAIVLVAGGFYLFSLVLGRHEGILGSRMRRHLHKES